MYGSLQSFSLRKLAATLPTSITSIRKTGTSTVSSMSLSVDGFDVNFNVSLERLLKYTVAIMQKYTCRYLMNGTNKCFRGAADT